MSASVHQPGPFKAAQDVLERSKRFMELDGYPLAEVVQWLSPISPRVMLCKNGSMLSAIAFEGLDIDSSSDDKMNALRSQLDYALQQIGRATPVLAWHVRRRITRQFPRACTPMPSRIA